MPNQFPSRNVLGGPLSPCGSAPLTGFFRDGCCNTGEEDTGSHTVCALLTDEFLSFSFACGNDLMTPRPEFGFEGLKPGDRWCVCAARWKEALDAGVPCPVILEATHERALEVVSLQDLITHSASPGRPS